MLFIIHSLPHVLSLTHTLVLSAFACAIFSRTTASPRNHNHICCYITSIFHLKNSYYWNFRILEKKLGQSFMFLKINPSSSILVLLKQLMGFHNGPESHLNGVAYCLQTNRNMEVRGHQNIEVIIWLMAVS